MAAAVELDVFCLLEHIEQFCFFGKLCFVNPSGDHLQQPIPLSVKMEDLLRVVLTQHREIAAAAGLSDHRSNYHRVPLSLKMEELLGVVLVQRKKIAAMAGLSERQLAT